MVNFEQFRKVSDRPPKWQLFMKTTDNFCDNFDGDRVEVLLLDNRKSSSGAWVRVYVGGTDDMALVRDYFGDDRAFDEALSVINSLEEPIRGKGSEAATKRHAMARSLATRTF